jgi:hypothetical protein
MVSARIAINAFRKHLNRLASAGLQPVDFFGGFLSEFYVPSLLRSRLQFSVKTGFFEDSASRMDASNPSSCLIFSASPLF